MPTPYLVGQANAVTGSATLTVSVAVGTAKGDVITVGANTSSGGAAITGVTDSKGNVYTARVSDTAQVVTSQFTADASSNPSGTVALTTLDTVTVTYSSTNGTKCAGVIGCAGVSALQPVDQAVGADNAGSANPAVTSGVLASPNQVAIAVCGSGNGGGAITWGAGWTPLVSQHNGVGQWLAMAYQVAPSSAALTASGTLTSIKWAMLLVTLPLAPAGQAGRTTRVRHPGVRFTRGGKGAPVFTGPLTPAVFTPPRKPVQRVRYKPVVTPRGSKGAPVTFVATTPATFTPPRKTSRIAHRPVVYPQGSAGAPVTAVAPPAVPVFPAVPGLAQPGASQPGQPLAPGSVPAGAYLIGVQSGPAGSATTVITAVNATGAGTGTVVAVSASAAAPTAVVDSAGNSYTLATSDASGNEPTWMFVALGTAALAIGSTITVTWTTTSGTKNAIAVTAPGVAVVDAMDQAAFADGNSAAPAVTTGALAVAGELGIAAISSASAGGAVAWGGGWAAQATAHNGTSAYLSVAVQPLATTAPVTASGTLPASAPWTAAAVTLAPPAAAPSIMQTVQGTVVNEYGITSVEMDSTDGNALMVLAGWNLAPGVTTAPMPAMYVTDSAGNGNVWHALATSPGESTASRCAAWICTNAQAVEWVSVGLTSFASSVSFVVVEIADMPAFVSLDVSVTAFVAPGGGSSLSLLGTASQADIAFALLTAGATGLSVATPPAGWVPMTAFPVATPPGLHLAQVAFPNWTTIFPYWLPAAAPGPLAASWTLSGLPGTAGLAGLLVAISASPATPQLISPDFPLIKVEAAFGYLPGDPTQAPPAWTDITGRCIAKDGDPWIDWSYGRQYELSTPEAGKITVGVNNSDGAFTPGNTASPWYPDVKVGTPIRVTAYWAGRWWNVAYGYVERWPQEWPDLPQWGLSKMVATDGLAVMASTQMPSALEGDILLDGPYAFLPGSEQYFTFTSGFGGPGQTGSGFPGIGGGNTPGIFTPAEAQGLPAANASRTNQKPGVYVDGAGSNVLSTGQTLNLLGDSGTGFGLGSVTGTPARGPGMIYADPAMPGPASTTGMTVELWVIVSALTSNGVTLLTAYGPPSPYNLFQFIVAATSVSGGSLVIFLPGTGPWHSVPFTASPNPQQIVVATSTSGGVTDLSLYVNGTLSGIWQMPGAAITGWTAIVAGPARYQFGFQPDVLAYTAAKLAIYDYQLPPARIYSHWATGAQGALGDTFTQRMAKILDWGFLALPRGGPATYQGSAGDVFQAQAYDLGGSNASDGASTVAAGDGGYYVAMPNGVVTVIPRWWNYRLTGGITFGDAAAPGAEVPYLGDQAWDFDNTYLYNVSQASLVQGANQGIVVASKDFASQDQYFTRSGLQVQIETTSNYDAYDASTYGLAKYAQPALRVRGMTVDAASNPAAFPAVLGTRAGDVVTVIRRPVGGAVIQSVVQVQKVGVKIGPGMFRGSYQVSPYVPPDSDALLLDVTGSNVTGTGSQPR